MGRPEHNVALSAFAYLFSEMVQYQSMRIQTAIELERRLEDSGHSVGLRILELLTHRERQARLEKNVVGVLQVSWRSYYIAKINMQFVSSHCWQALFGKVADSLERSTENENECMF